MMKPKEKLTPADPTPKGLNRLDDGLPKISAEREKDRKWNAAMGMLTDAAAEFKRLHVEAINAALEPKTGKEKKLSLLKRRARIIVGLPQRLLYIFGIANADPNSPEVKLMEEVCQLAALAKAALASPLAHSLEVLLRQKELLNEPNALEKLVAKHGNPTK